MSKQRLDSLIVSKGLIESKNRARAAIMAGEVTVNRVVASKAGSLVSDDAVILIAEKPPYVSRGGFKLEHALNTFQIDVKSMTCLDVGASTGGFTDCLLQQGAARVYALDVGYGQIDYRLRRDKRVIVMEKVNAHYPFELPEKVNLATMDLSFISVTSVIPNILPHLAPGGELVVLFKPQFEVNREDVGKGGVIRDPLIHAKAISRFIVWVNQHELQLLNLVASPILGAEGNTEFLIQLRPFKL